MGLYKIKNMNNIVQIAIDRQATTWRTLLIWQTDLFLKIPELIESIYVFRANPKRPQNIRKIKQFKILELTSKMIPQNIKPQIYLKHYGTFHKVAYEFKVLNSVNSKTQKSCSSVSGNNTIKLKLKNKRMGKSKTKPKRHSPLESFKIGFKITLWLQRKHRVKL